MQVLTTATRSRRTLAGALAVAAFFALAVLPVGARARDLITPHVDGHALTIPQPVGSGTHQAPAAPVPSSDPAPTSGSGQSPTGDSDPAGSEQPWDRPGDFGIPNFVFHKPDQPPSGSSRCDLGCEQQWRNFYMAAAAAAEDWAERSTGAEAAHAGALADSLWESAQSADERLNGATAAGPASDSSVVSVIVDAVSGADPIVPQDHELELGPPLDLTSNVEALATMMTAGAILFFPQVQLPGTTVCPKKETPDGKVPICPK
jgi:hypothetical protein